MRGSLSPFISLHGYQIRRKSAHKELCEIIDKCMTTLEFGNNVKQKCVSAYGVEFLYESLSKNNL